MSNGSVRTTIWESILKISNIYYLVPNSTPMKTTILWIMAFCMLTGCAISRKVDYEGVHANIPDFRQHIAIASWDQREQVLSAARKTDFVGYMRSGAGIAYPMGTESGKPLMDVMSTDIAESLKAKGNSTMVVITQPTEKQSQILEKLAKTKNARLILINCKEFFTDGYGAVSLMYNLELNIYSGEGSLIKEKTFSGKRAIGGSVAWGPGKYKLYMPEALKKLIEEAFNDSEIIASLQN